MMLKHKQLRSERPWAPPKNTMLAKILQKAKVYGYSKMPRTILWSVTGTSVDNARCQYRRLINAEAIAYVMSQIEGFRDSPLRLNRWKSSLS